MSSRFRRRAVALAAGLALLACATIAPAASRQLRVCADPDNLPFSHRDGSGFENRIAQRVATALEATLDTRWRPMQRGFVRKTLDAGVCDVVVGVPVGLEGVRTTRPYYRSRYAFVVPADLPPVASLDDPRLIAARIGVVLPGMDMAETPAGAALARRRITDNVRGYTALGSRPAAERIGDDLESGRLDLAIVWGPQAAWTAQRPFRPCVVMPVAGRREDEPLEFSIAMAVRRDDPALQRELDRVLPGLQPDIDAILHDFGVPRVDATSDTRLAERP